MSHSLGIYYAPEHARQDDRDYIQKLQPKVIRLLDCDVQQIADMHALCPGAIICPRTWSVDDNNGEAVRHLMANPVSTGNDHANAYRSMLDRWKREASQRGLQLPADNEIYFNAANEPNQGGTPDKIAAYTVAFLNRCYELGIQATALCLGVGWPDNSGPDTPVNWEPYSAIVEPIKRGSHWLELHEYHYKDGPQNNWTWWAGRHLQCPFDVPILLGEVGIDCYVDQARWAKDGGNRGWQGNVTPDQYAEMIEWHISHSDTRVVAALPFVTDFRNREWESFNTRAAHPAFIARKDTMVPQTKPATTPPPPATTTPLFVNVPAGARLRGAPTTNANVLQAIPFGQKVESFGTEMAQGAPWNHVTAPDGQQGWILGVLLSPTEPAKPPVTPTTGTGPTEPVKPVTGDKWARTIAFILKEEGGYTANDEGNPANFGINQGANPDLDVKNITREQAVERFRTKYYIGSGADKLDWPFCLLVMNAAVQFGEGEAAELLKESGNNPLRFQGLCQLYYSQIKQDNWNRNGKAWMARCGSVLIEAAN